MEAGFQLFLILLALLAGISLLARASPDRVTLWERGPDSYVVILPAQSDAVAAIARPIVED